MLKCFLSLVLITSSDDCVCFHKLSSYAAVCGWQMFFLSFHRQQNFRRNLMTVAFVVNLKVYKRQGFF